MGEGPCEGEELEEIPQNILLPKILDNSAPVFQSEMPVSDGGRVAGKREKEQEGFLHNIPLPNSLENCPGVFQWEMRGGGGGGK